MPMTIRTKQAESAILHGFSRLEAVSAGDLSWINFFAKDWTGPQRCELAVFMPAKLASMIEDAFHDYEDWESNQETAPISDYTDAIADLQRQQEEARALK